MGITVVASALAEQQYIIVEPRDLAGKNSLMYTNAPEDAAAILIPDSSRNTTIAQKLGINAAIAEHVADKEMLRNTVFFLPTVSVRKPETCEVEMMPMEVTLVIIPIRIVSNSKSHFAGGRM